MNRMLKSPYKCSAALLLGLFLVALIPGRAPAYVMPAEQLLYLMGTKFSRFKTMVITQTTRVENRYETDAGVVMNEKIWLKAPALYRSELIGEPDGQDVGNSLVSDREPGGDMAFRRLLMANDLESIMALLTHMGVNLESVSLSRHEGVVVYQLGNKDPESPTLLIDKNSFLPMIFRYPSPTGPGPGMVTIRFGDYQEIGKGWYPYEITYFSDDETLERYSIVDLQVNATVEPPLSEITFQRTPPFHDLGDSEDLNGEDERLREMIELLKDKYQ
ncbi:MAG: hypothetical protein JRF34_02085 [Deltaproteobacteria bacterium]|nr:hypothetical protein [Deltaproteobacteria bacterium]